MATLMDISIFKHFSSFFTFILIWIVLFAILEKTAILGKERKSLNGLLAVVVAFLVLTTSSAIGLIGFMVPWFLVLIVFAFLIIFTVRIFGIGEDSIVAAGKDVYPYIIVIAIVILLFGLGNVFGQSALNLQNNNGGGQVNTNSTCDPDVEECVTDTNTGNYSNNLFNTIFHPKVLGLVFILFCGVFILVFLTKHES
jgi:hypothetical protein